MVTTASGERHEGLSPSIPDASGTGGGCVCEGHLYTEPSYSVSLSPGHQEHSKAGSPEQQRCPPRSRATLCLEIPSDPFPFCQGHPEEAAKAEFMCPTGSHSWKGRGGVVFLHFPHQSLRVEGDECLECNQPLSCSEKGALGCCSLRLGDNGGVAGVPPSQVAFEKLL